MLGLISLKNETLRKRRDNITDILVTNQIQGQTLANKPSEPTNLNEHTEVT